MSGKFLFVVGLGVGYVLGSKAGRQRYEQIASAANKVWSSKAVQAPKAEVQKFVDAQTPKIVDAASNVATNAIHKVTRRNKDA